MLTSLGGTHRNVPFSAIERLHAGIADQATALELLQQRLGPVVLLQTCNRFELYVSGERDHDCLMNALSDVTHAPRADVLDHLRFSRGIDAVEHLFEVASGIDSLSLGEYEVLGQVRAALSQALAVGTEDEVLTHVFHGAVRTGRRVRAETTIAKNPLSISSLAAIEIADALPSLPDAALLVVGAGEAGRLTARALGDLGARDITILNRTVERAEQVAATVGGRGAGLDCLPRELARADAVVSATSASRPVIDADIVARAMEARGGRELVIIDIAMPRDVHPEASARPDVRYRGIEQLRDVSERNACRRADALPEARAIVAEELCDFGRWWNARDAIPTIRALAAHADSVREAQVQRAMRKMSLSSEDQQQLELMTRSIVKQLLHAPITALRDGSDAAQLGTVRELFGLSEG